MSRPGSPSRRRFLLLLGSFAAGVVFSLRWRMAPFERLLRERASFLTFAPGTARAFSKEYRLRFIRNLGVDAWNEYVGRIEAGSAPFPLGELLLSTDYFLNGERESEPLRYMGLYDPYEGCRNPFARFD